LKNISQDAVLGQLVSDGAHSFLYPAGQICASLSGPKDRLKITKQNEIVLCTLTVLREKLAGLLESSDHRHSGGAPAWLVV